MTEVAQAYEAFPARTPSNDTEARLIELQRETDEIGLELARELRFSPQGDSEKAQKLLDAAEEAGGLLRGASLDYKKSGFFSRYLYDARKPDAYPRVVYPGEYFYHSAYIQGEFNDVKAITVESPAMDRQGPLGYRLCAVVDATRVMGWQSKTPDRIYLPVGEILLEAVSHEQSMAECLVPASSSS